MIHPFFGGAGGNCGACLLSDFERYWVQGQLTDLVLYF